MSPRLLLASAAIFLTACPSGGPADDDDATGPDAEDGPWYCVDEPGAPTAEGTGWSVQGDRYDAYLEVDEAEAQEIAWLLEAAYDAMEVWFAATPSTGGPLRVELYETEQRFWDAIEADGLEPPFGAGGYYHSATQTAYAWRQPTRWFTRVLVLHEAVHQFHQLTSAEGHFTPGWYNEGVAEYLSLHDWDDGCARLGRVPMISLEDLHARARNELAGGGVDLDGEALSRPVAGTFFGFLDDAYEAEFAQFRDAMDGGSSESIPEFGAALGAPPSAFEPEFIDWVDDHQQPMTPTYLEWIHHAPGKVSGWANGVLTIAPMKAPLERFEASFASPPNAAYAGVLLGFDDPSNYITLLLNAEGTFSAFTVIQGAVNWPGVEGEAVPVDGVVTLTVEHGGGEATVTAGGASFVVNQPFAPAGGGAVYDGAVTFEDITWE